MAGAEHLAETGLNGSSSFGDRVTGFGAFKSPIDTAPSNSTTPAIVLDLKNKK